MSQEKGSNIKEKLIVPKSIDECSENNYKDVTLEDKQISPEELSLGAESDLDYESIIVKEKDHKDESQHVSQSVNDHDSDDGLCSGEDTQDIEEGEVKDDSPDKVIIAPKCRYFQRGQCTWGSNCHFSHCTDKGLYNMFSNENKTFSKPNYFCPPRMPPIICNAIPETPFPYPPPLPPPTFIEKDNSWDKGLEETKKLLNAARERKERKSFFERKLSPESNYNKENLEFIEKTKRKNDYEHNYENQAFEYKQIHLKSNKKHSPVDKRNQNEITWYDPWRRSSSPKNKKYRSPSCSSSSSWSNSSFSSRALSRSSTYSNSSYSSNGSKYSKERNRISYDKRSKTDKPKDLISSRVHVKKSNSYSNYKNSNKNSSKSNLRHVLPSKRSRYKRSISRSLSRNKSFSRSPSSSSPRKQFKKSFSKSPKYKKPLRSDRIKKSFEKVHHIDSSSRSPPKRPHTKSPLHNFPKKASFLDKSSPKKKFLSASKETSNKVKHNTSDLKKNNDKSNSKKLSSLSSITSGSSSSQRRRSNSFSSLSSKSLSWSPEVKNDKIFQKQTKDKEPNSPISHKEVHYSKSEKKCHQTKDKEYSNQNKDKMADNPIKPKSTSKTPSEIKPINKVEEINNFIGAKITNASMMTKDMKALLKYANLSSSYLKDKKKQASTSTINSSHNSESVNDVPATNNLNKKSEQEPRENSGHKRPSNDSVLSDDNKSENQPNKKKKIENVPNKKELLLRQLKAIEEAINRKKKKK